MLTIREFVEVNPDAESIIITEGNDSLVYCDPAQILGKMVLVNARSSPSRNLKIEVLKSHSFRTMPTPR